MGHRVPTAESPNLWTWATLWRKGSQLLTFHILKKSSPSCRPSALNHPRWATPPAVGRGTKHPGWSLTLPTPGTSAGSARSMPSLGALVDSTLPVPTPWSV